jgi:hypothetical protein
MAGGLIVVRSCQNAGAERNAEKFEAVPARCHNDRGRGASAIGATRTLWTRTGMDDVDDAHADRIDDHNVSLYRGVFEDVSIVAERRYVGQIAQREGRRHRRADRGGYVAASGPNALPAHDVIKCALLN